MGRGYACRFAAHTLRQAGFPVTEGSASTTDNGAGAASKSTGGLADAASATKTAGAAADSANGTNTAAGAADSANSAASANTAGIAANSTASAGNSSNAGNSTADSANGTNTAKTAANSTASASIAGIAATSTASASGARNGTADSANGTNTAAGGVPERIEGISAAELAGFDICLTDDPRPLADLLGGDEPWPADLRRLTLVEIGPPAAAPDANARIAELSGIGAVIGEPDGPGIAPPGRMLEAIAGLQAATAALAGWLGARRDGIGEHVVVDPVSCLAGMSGVNAIQFLNYGRRWRRSGPSASGSGGPFPFRMFRCRDGWVVVICRARVEWEAFLALLGDPSWADRPEFGDQIVIAAEHADEVAALIEEILSTRTVAEVVAAGREFRVPIAPLRTVDEAMADPLLFDRGEPVPAITTERPAPLPCPWHSRRSRRTEGGPLAGLRVLDLGWVWAAPVASAWLADLGADVVKVESLDRLDVGRRRGVDFPVGLPSMRATLPGHERAWLFNAANRNKRGIRLELKDPADHARFLELVADADVVVESFATGVLERLHLAPERLFAANPGLLLLSMGGRTVDGRHVARSYAPILTALAGIEATVTDRAGAPLGLLNWGVADPNAGAWATFAIVAALAADRGGSHLLLSQLRALVNTCASRYRGDDPPRAELADPAEVTLAHLAGTAPGPLGDLYRSVLVRGWSPEFGERLAFGSPWRFRRMSVGVRAAAPLFASTPADQVLAEWRREEAGTLAPADIAK